ncbi:MAG: DNA adenine methylase [Phycicoccus sp.]|nr:DNA adenine methylase [Phycicoccus sp.]
MSQPAKPVLQYPGSKVRLAQTIIDLLGPHGTYVEPYCGSAAVFLAKPRVGVELIGDMNDMLILFYETLRKKKTRDALIDALTYTPYARRELELCMEDDPALGKVERSRRFMVRTNQTFLGSAGSSNWVSTMAPSSNHSNATKWMNYVTRLSVVSARLAGVQIECVDAVEILQRAYLRHSDRIAIYLDPPYIRTDRSGARYTEDVDLLHHQDMLETAVKLTGPMVISAYENALYDDALGKAGANWSKILVKVAASSSAGKGSVARRTEVLWASPACPPLPKPVRAPRRARR